MATEVTPSFVVTSLTSSNVLPSPGGFAAAFGATNT